MTIYKELKNPSQYHPSFIEGFQHFNEEEYADALSLFLTAFNSDEEKSHTDVFYNLAYVASHSNHRELAIKAIAQGRAIDPYDTQLIHLRRALGLRRKPVLSFLSRENMLNILLGKILYLVHRPA